MIVLSLLVGHIPNIPHHAIELRDRGFTVVPNAGLSPTLIGNARAAVDRDFSALQSAATTVGLDSTGQNYLFAEFATRHQFRFDLRPCVKQSAWTSLAKDATSAASPIIEFVHTSLPPHPDDSEPLLALSRHLVPAQPTLDQIGAILSQPGAAAQRFHADADDTHFQLARLCPRHRLYNVFIPLVDVTTDGTQFWPGSHLGRNLEGQFRAAVERSARSADGTQGHLEDDAQARAEMEAPACPAGGMIIFDFRILHRGLPNAGRDRPLVYTVLGTGYAHDRANFPTDSLLSLAAAIPDGDDAESRAMRSSMRAEIRAMWPTWDELYESEDEAERFLEPRERFVQVDESRSDQGMLAGRPTSKAA